MKFALGLLLPLAGCCECVLPPIAGIAAPATRLELTPAELTIPVGETRGVHVEAFAHDTPLLPLDVNVWITSGGDVVALERYHTPLVLLRGLQVGEAELGVRVSDELEERVSIVVTGAPRE